MKIFESNNSSNIKAETKHRGRTQKNRNVIHIFQMITENSKQVINLKSSEIIRLQEIKDTGKELKGNPWNLVLVGHHANAKVRHWCLRLVNSGVRVEVDGKMEIQKIDAFEFGDGVVFANVQAMRHEIAKQKNQKVKAQMEERLKAVTSLPRRESYY